MEVTPYLLVSSLISQLVTTWAYRHPEIRWINRSNIKAISATVSAVAAVGTAYASGTLDAPTVQAALDAAWNAFVGAGMSVAFYEWPKDGASDESATQ